MVASLPTITVVQPSADAGKRTRTQKTIPFMTVIGLEASNKFYNELIFMKKKKRFFPFSNVLFFPLNPKDSKVSFIHSFIRETQLHPHLFCPR